MQKMNSFWYYVREGFLGLWKNRLFSVASVVTIAASLFLTGIFRMVTVNFEHMLKEAETNVSVTVFFDDGTAEDTIFALREQVKTRSEVDSVTYVSAEEAWKNYQAKYLNAELTASFGEDNPLKDSASLVIYLRDVGEQTELVTYLKTFDAVRKVNDSESTAKSLDDLIRMISWVSAILISLLVGISVFLIGITVATGINIRRDEILIMNIIGATDWFIKAPFLVEGLVIGAVGSILPVMFLKSLYHSLVTYFTEHFGSVFHQSAFLSESVTMGKLTPLMFVVGLGIGIFGSYITASLQLRRISISQ